MKRLRLSNSLFLVALVAFLPIYPVFGSFLYDGSRRDALRSDIDTSTILDTVDSYDEEETAISPDTSSEPQHDWTGRTTIETYTVQPGDTIAQLALDFHLTHNTIRWSNNLPTTFLKAGQKLLIPPADGIIYITKSGDTLEAIAKKYKVSVQKIQTTNNLGSTLGIDQMLFLPGAQQPVIVPQESQILVRGKFDLKVISPTGAGFVPGQCTYFVAKHWPVKWRGNARAWFKNAKAAGFKTGQTAKPGAIVVWYGPGYNLTYGHVAIVVSVNAKEGTMIVKDMNYAGPWKITTREEKIKNKYIIGFIHHP